MSENKKKNPTYTTPAGTAKFPWITQADTKFNPDGEFRTKLVLSKEEAAPIIEMIDAAVQAILDETLSKAADAKAKKKIKMSDDKPYKPVEDDNGDETGEIEFNFKQKKVIKGKDEKTYTIKINIFDAKGKPITKPVNIYGGSTIKVAYQIIPYYSPKFGAGATLRLCAVQVIDLVSGGGDAASYGFGEEEGYEYEDIDGGASFDASADGTEEF